MAETQESKREKLRDEEKKALRAAALAEEAKKPEKWSENFDMSSIPEAELVAYWSLFYATGMNGDLSGGRPRELKPCPECGKFFGARDMRKHLRQVHHFKWKDIHPNAHFVYSTYKNAVPPSPCPVCKKVFGALTMRKHLQDAHFGDPNAVMPKAKTKNASTA